MTIILPYNYSKKPNFFLSARVEDINRKKMTYDVYFNIYVWIARFSRRCVQSKIMYTNALSCWPCCSRNIAI